VLNEVGVSPLAEIITAQQRARIATHYEEELRSLVQPLQPGRTRRQMPVEAPRAPAPSPAASGVSAAAPRAAAPPRQPADWSWLVEQQANLFLFAGAFLTVVAALIYVGYSGQAVDGSLKMALLVGYTLAFLTAGAICLRVPRVAIAGQVFFAVGALLVPLNFAAARSILSGDDLNPRTLWLAGSITTAAFYTAVAWLGIGKQYTFGAGVAFVSATMAAVVRLDVAPEWASICFIALAAAMWLASEYGPSTLRARVAGIWTLQAHVVVAGGVAFALLLAPFAYTHGHREFAIRVSTFWFLPIALAAATAYAALPTLVRRQQLAGIATIAAFSGAFVSVVYAIDVAGEYYAIAFAALSVVLGVLAFPAKRADISPRLPKRFGDTLRDAGVGATALAVVAVFITMQSALESTAGYHIETHWFAAIAAALVLAFYVIDAFGQRKREGVSGLAVALTATCLSIVYAINVSREYYAFALIAPAVALATASRWAPATATRRLAGEWRADAILVARAAAALGIVVALVAAISGEDAHGSYHPQFRAFLPIAFAAAAAFCAIDASRARRPETSAALLVALAGAIVGVAYALDAQAAYYGAAFAAAGAAVALGGRVRTPGWLDTRVRDAVSAAAFTIAWLPFEGAYENMPRVGAGVHVAAAAFYALAAIFQRSELTLERLLDAPAAARVRVTVGWLYAAGLTATLGYLHFLNSLPGNETVNDVLRLGYPLLAASMAFLAAGVATRWLRPEFRMHLYAMSLVAAIVSLTTPTSAETLALLLTAYVAASLAVAVFEDEPLLAVPAAAFGFGAIAAWRVRVDAPISMLPIAFSAVALFAAAAGAALRTRARWSLLARVSAGTYAAGAPATGFLMLATRTHHGLLDGTRFYESALYEWSLLALAFAGLLAAAEAAISGRRWIFVPASATLTAALLLQIGRFNPENAQAYTLVIGAYLVLLGLLGLWKFRLVPDLAAFAPVVEAIGAAFIMAPSMIQSLEPGGGRYEWIVLAEASAFFTASIVLRRRGMLSAAIVAMVLVAGRVLFDAINALPNWVVVMVAGMALLGIGMGILLGRDRWSRWQDALLDWWGRAGAAAH